MKIDLDLFEKTFLEYVENRQKKDGEVLELLANKETGEFSGHYWAHNCAYSLQDLEKNGDRYLTDQEGQIVQNWQEEKQQEEIDNQQEEIEKINKIEDYLCKNFDFKGSDRAWKKAVRFLQDVEGEDIENYDEEIIEIIEENTKE